MDSVVRVPVVLIVFRRPELTKQVFAAIREAKPTRLFVVADGPRAGCPEDVEGCCAVREIVTAVDWPCDAVFDFAETNMGLKQRVVTGLDRVFSEVESAIVLEDDCFPAKSFFPFCEAVLEKYAGDDRVMHVTGTNNQRGRRRSNGSYYFGHYAHSWGWATWRRAWAQKDIDMLQWEEFRDAGQLSEVLDTKGEVRFWTRTLNQARAVPHSWFYPWQYSLWLRGGLSVISDVNLVSNTGFGKEGTHTTAENHRLSYIPRQELDEIIHPTMIVRQRSADRVTFAQHHQGPLYLRLGVKLPIPPKIRTLLKQMLFGPKHL